MVVAASNGLLQLLAVCTRITPLLGSCTGCPAVWGTQGLVFFRRSLFLSSITPLTVMSGVSGLSTMYWPTPDAFVPSKTMLVGPEYRQPFSVATDANLLVALTASGGVDCGWLRRVLPTL